MTCRLVILVLLVLPFADLPAFGQATERIGPRAPGMGGAFVAVADDSSAGWWNPAGLAAGPFFDLAIGAGSDAAGFSAGVPPFGVSYYRFFSATHPTAGPGVGREHGRARPLRASQIGVTLLHTLIDGLHAGATVRMVRGEVFDAGTDTAGDVDLGLLAVFGAARVGVLVRNVRAPRVGDVWLDRIVRAGVAWDAERAGYGPAMVAFDIDLREYEADAGRRQVIAGGVERWFRERRVGVRAGARTNLAPGGEAAVTLGASGAVRAGLFVDAHIAVGGEAEQGWGVAGRVSF